MITEEKIKQIRKQLSKGEPEGEIKNGLRNDGYTEEEIGELFFNLFSKKTSSDEVKNNKGQVFILIGACFIIGGILMVVTKTWLQKFGIPLIILGSISVCVKYFISGKDDRK